MSRWLTTGNTYGLQDSVIYIRKHGSLNPFVWGGRCWQLEDATETLGGLSVTTRFNPRGGVERDTVRAEPPGETSGTLTMKRLQADRAKSDLKLCYWDIDQRYHCEGTDRDAPFAWEEITRHCYAKFSERTTSGTSYESDEDAMVTFPWAALYSEDIHRVGGSEATAVAGGDLILDVKACQPVGCNSRCSDQEDCVFAAVTEDDSTNSYLLVNLEGGEADAWTSVTLTAFGTNDADRLVCLGEFVVIISTADTSIIYSDDRGTTQVNIDQATVTDWTSNAPMCIDAIDQTFIVMGGANGYVYASYDSARTWETKDTGDATTNALHRIMIARDNPQVIYAISNATDVVIKSENGGESWFSLGAVGTTGTGLLSLWVIDQATVLVGTDAGELFETEDGGTTWTEQVDLPGMTSKADVDINAICGCGCGVLYLVTDEATVAGKVYRNVDGGASGRWYEPQDIGTLTIDNAPVEAIACCGPNHAVAVGGKASTGDATLLIE